MNTPAKHPSHLDTLIPGEVRQGDPFAEVLKNLAARPEVRTILEVGSSAGSGSTAALVAGAQSRSDKPALFCLEVSGPRFAKLRDTYTGQDFVHCFRSSSVNSTEFPKADAVNAWLDEGSAVLEPYPRPTVLSWLADETDYVREQGVDASGIALIKAQRGVEAFDLVLLDGGDFTGEADLRQVDGALYLVLHGTRALRNYRNHARLKADARYHVVLESEVGEGFSVFARLAQAASPSELDVIIPAEISHDRFYDTLRALARRADIKTILEIGSSAGGGSTDAFVTGLKERSEPAHLYCMEVSAARFAQLRDTYAPYDFVHCFNVSSVPLRDFASREAVSQFLDTVPSALRAYPKAQVLGWLDADIEYVKSHGVDANGIEHIKKETGIEAFDLVLIDGSEFTGEAELRDVYGAKFIALDDINAYKCWSAHLRLATDPRYRLIVEDRTLRNGFSVFRRVDEVAAQSQLDVIIPGEIRNDPFYDVLKGLAQRPEVKTILEIGSSAGGGSTDAFVSGLKEKPGGGTNLFCMEVSAARFEQLQATYREYPFVHCYNVSSVPLSDFPSREEVAQFYDTVQSGLRAYTKETVLGWLDADLAYVKSHGLDLNGIEKIKSDRGIEKFDLVLIDGSEFTGEAELRYVHGAKLIALDDINNYKCWRPYFQLKDDPSYELIAENRGVRNGYAVFQRVEQQKQLPVHFFTIVLNGMPFIRYHFEMMSQLPFDWHWHVVEGVAELKHDTAWSLRNGGAVTEELHFLGRSRDGTSEYLDELAARHPDKVTIYRKPAGAHWDGKLEMVSAPLANIGRECLLWEIDVDEFWTAEKIVAARQLFLSNPSATAAFYWCHFFVGPDLVVSTRNCYSQNPGMEWLRTWRYVPNCRWAAHEPPRLAALQADGGWADQGLVNPLRHEQTEAAGLVFHHYAYAKERQLRFKEIYYGYANAVEGWRRLQAQTEFPRPLKEFFPWVHDETQVDRTERRGVPALERANFIFGSDEANAPRSADIVIDAVFFQYYNTGIARVWRSLLREWAKTELGPRLLILNRGGKAPRIPGLRYLDFPAHNYADLPRDRELVQRACDFVGARLFISSYYTSPVKTSAVMLVHDMIPELLGADLSQPMWVEKTHAIKTAAAFVCVSEKTADDLRRFHPEIPPAKITVAHNGVSFTRPSAERLDAFAQKHGIVKPYFQLSGARSSYKNSTQFFGAFAKFGEARNGYAIVCTGPGEALPPEFAALAGEASVHMLDLPDDELECAYAGAIALVYPSLYEGFGMPVIEAMACGCPVITCPTGPLPEVAGEAAIYVPPHDLEETFRALCRVQDVDVRADLIAKGLERATRFSWEKMAAQMAATADAVMARA